jgi:hypothetical protein
MPIAICLRDGLWWAAALGFAAMGTPLLLALRRRPHLAVEPDGRRTLAAT